MVFIGVYPPDSASVPRPPRGFVNHIEFSWLDSEGKLRASAAMIAIRQPLFSFVGRVRFLIDRHRNGNVVCIFRDTRTVVTGIFGQNFSNFVVARARSGAAKADALDLSVNPSIADIADSAYGYSLARECCLRAGHFRGIVFFGT